MILRVVILSTSLVLAGCSFVKTENSYLHDRKNDYQVEQSVPRMKMPANISADKISDFYEIPELNDHLPSPESQLAPPGAKQWEAVRIEKTEKSTRFKSFYLPKSDPNDVVDEEDQELKLAAQKPNAVAKLKGFTNDMPTMTIDAKFDAAWKAMEKALKVAKYPVFGKDKTLKIYFIADAPAEGGKVTRYTPLYQVQLIERNQVTLVYVIDNNGDQLPNNKSEEVLKALNLGMKGKRSINILKWFFEV